MINKPTRGVVHGKTIELSEDLGLADGQEVEVRVRVIDTGRTWGEGILRSAGIAADIPDWDDVMEEIHRGRAGSSQRDQR